MEKISPTVVSPGIGQTLLTWLAGSALLFGAFLLSSELFIHLIPVPNMGGDAMGMGGAFLLVPYLGFGLLVYLVISVLNFVRSWTFTSVLNFFYAGLWLGLGFAIYAYFVFESYFGKQT